LADSAGSVVDLDVVALAARIDDVARSLADMTPGAELDRAIVLLDRYKSVHLHLIGDSPDDSRTGLGYSWFSGLPARHKCNSDSCYHLAHPKPRSKG
jgi:hypothetical protein